MSIVSAWFHRRRAGHDTPPRVGTDAWATAHGLHVTRLGLGRRRYRDPRWDQPELVAHMRANAARAQAAAEARARARTAETGQATVVSVQSTSPEVLAWFVANPIRHR